MEDGYGFLIFISLTIVAIIFMIGMVVGNIGTNEYIEQLGQSICEEEYGMDFESYQDNTLRCKPVKEKYDGIKVEVPKGVD